MKTNNNPEIVERARLLATEVHKDPTRKTKEIESNLRLSWGISGIENKCVVKVVVAGDPSKFVAGVQISYGAPIKVK